MGYDKADLNPQEAAWRASLGYRDEPQIITRVAVLESQVAMLQTQVTQLLMNSRSPA